MVGMTVPLQTCLVAGLVIACRLFVDQRSLVSLGFDQPAARLTASPWFALAVGGLLATLPIALLLWLGRLRLEGAFESPQPLGLFPIMLLAAFHEELIFRGYLLRNMMEVGRPRVGVVVTSLLFSVVHATNPAFFGSPWNSLGVFAAGVLLGVSYLVSGNLWFPTALHFAWNFTLGGIFGLPVSGLPLEGLVDLESTRQELLTGGGFGIEGSPLVLAVIVSATFLLWFSGKREASTARRVPESDLSD
jgi:membrane protease YdiL (CAAX protease family)